jgi:excisionase family DNA binding protein
VPLVQQETYATPHPAQRSQQPLGGISRTTFYALVKEGELSLVKIGRRSFVQPEALDDFVGRKAVSLW